MRPNNKQRKQAPVVLVIDRAQSEGRTWVTFTLPRNISEGEARKLMKTHGYDPARWGFFAFGAFGDKTTWKCNGQPVGAPAFP